MTATYQDVEYDKSEDTPLNVIIITVVSVVALLLIVISKTNSL